ncbi:MAG: hypothetical protein K2X93_17195 [Candidatus Obscuribacterales bacterium]|nr:hypothetical protein [Candidatus Obscuribacterales bacterium]
MLLLKKRTKVPRYCLGELLLEAGVISPLILNNSVFMAQRTNTKLGRILVMSGHLTELDVDSALRAQKYLREGYMNLKLATELLQYGHEHQLTMDEAYLANYSVNRQYGYVSKLGKLLLAAGVIDDVQLDVTMNYAQKTSYPLGQALIHMSYITEETLVSCFNLQVLVRDSYIYFLDAAKLLRLVEKEGQSLEHLLRLLGLRSNTMDIHAPKLGELLVSASAISLEDSLILAELGIETDMMFGKLAATYHLVSQNVLDAAIDLQRQFHEDPLLTNVQATQILAMVHSTGNSLESVQEELANLDKPRQRKLVAM